MEHADIVDMNYRRPSFGPSPRRFNRVAVSKSRSFRSCSSRSFVEARKIFLVRCQQHFQYRIDAIGLRPKGWATGLRTRLSLSP
jgi:hypothetical protein